MKKLAFTIKINATAAKVWQVLWDDETYRKWTSPFQEGSYALSDWKEGSRIQFLTPEGNGMYSQIAETKPCEYMAFKHLGEIKKFIEQPESLESKSWSGAMETYSLTENDGVTTLTAQLDSNEQFQEFFNTAFPQAMALVKVLAEQPVIITVETKVSAPVSKVWNCWTSPEHITKWNNASDDWHTPRAENDLRKGGKFLSRMEAKDASVGFDFEGVYDEVKTNELIEYSMADGRKVKITFSSDGAAIMVSEAFEAETENSLELQRGGWQAILNNFKKHVESN